MQAEPTIGGRKRRTSKLIGKLKDQLKDGLKITK